MCYNIYNYIIDIAYSFSRFFTDCEKRVRIETQPDDIICTQCKLGFVELLSDVTAAATSRRILSSQLNDEYDLSSQFHRVLGVLLHPAPPLPALRNLADRSRSKESLFPPIRYNNNQDNHDENNEDEVDDDDDDFFRSIIVNVGQSVEEEDIRYDAMHCSIQTLEIIRRLRQSARRTSYEVRRRILNWVANSIHFNLETSDRYIGNPRDYVDEAEDAATLQDLVDAEGERGAPPAAMSVVEALKVKSVVDESFVCAICMDNGGGSGGDVVKEMPCGHGYHGDCIVTWLAARNTCPVCRFELPTDDADYEEWKKRFNRGSSSSSV